MILIVAGCARDPAAPDPAPFGWSAETAPADLPADRCVGIGTHSGPDGLVDLGYRDVETEAWSTRETWLADDPSQRELHTETYDDQHRVVASADSSTTDPQNDRTTTWVLDADGRVLVETAFDATGAPSIRYDHVYDGELLDRIDLRYAGSDAVGSVVEYTYDADDRRTERAVVPVGGGVGDTTTYVYLAPAPAIDAVAFYDYGNDGVDSQWTTWFDADGRPSLSEGVYDSTVTASWMSYDDAGNLALTETHTITLDESEWRETLNVWEDGRLLDSVTWDDSDLDGTYDALRSRVTWVWACTGDG